MPRFFYKQLNTMDCGVTCLRMIAKFYGKNVSLDKLREHAGYGKEGSSLYGIAQAAENIGFRTRAVQLNIDKLVNHATLPCLIHWNQNHFVLLISAKKRWFSNNYVFTIADPASDILTLDKNSFLQHWASTLNPRSEEVGTALLFEPTPAFYELENTKSENLSWGLILKYLHRSRGKLFQVFVALIIGSFLQLIFPFLTQSIVDSGINTKNLTFITVVLAAQLMLVFSRTIVEFIRSRLMLSVSTLVNVSILSDFWIKLTKLPLSHYDTYHTGDTLQRINDNKQIQSFLTGNILTTIFSIFSFIIYAFVLLAYSNQVFLIFTIGALLYFFWIKIFLKVRRKINYRNFKLSSQENTATLQLVQGMHEIRINNAEMYKRWEWENIQAALFKLNFKSLSYSQIQQAGAILINQGKDVIITFLVAQMVVNGELSMGALLAVQYIIGQLNNPIEQWIGFVQSAQDAKISLERLNEIHQMPDEEISDRKYLRSLPTNKSITFSNVNFSYPGVEAISVLNNINLTIEEGKITSIVGISGSGKTTLMKLLLRYYNQYNGEIRIGESNLQNISPSYWRSHCGAVLQDGFIFNDTIARNIAVAGEEIDYDQLSYACRSANILSFIETLPNGLNTKLGVSGLGISQGQKQRILIARAIYKNPDYLFLDEATNSLDANNEKEIVENLNEFFKGRTVVIIAHRLSTVKHSDHIILLHKGHISEEGTHDALIARRERYYELVKNQLELGN